MNSELWDAPQATAPVDATVLIPGSKSLTNRYLVLSALATGPSTLRAPLISRDSELMANALQQLGATIERSVTSDSSGRSGRATAELWHITPGSTHGDVTVECGLAGTVMRFVPPVAALHQGLVAMDGDEGARVRPMLPVLSALRDLGIRIDSDESGHLPITIHGSGSVRGGTVKVDASATSQFVSGLLLAGARFDEGLTIVNTGPTLPSLPHIDMTIESLRDCGVVLDGSQSHDGIWRVEPGPIAPLDIAVEPDLSNAGPFIAAALVAGGQVTIPGWPQATTQAGDALRDILDMMGADVALDRDGLHVSASGTIYGIDIDMHDVGELTPVVAALAALAEGPSRIRGVAHIRGHETDRLAALTREINNLGGQVTETDDGLAFAPATLHGGIFHTYHDHRMATTAAVLGLRVPGIQVENIATTAKTMPSFVHLWRQELLGLSTD